MAIYKIKNVAEDKCITVNRTNRARTLSDHLNVILSADLNSVEQMWSIDRLNTGVNIRSAVDETFGLNVYRTGSPYNCDISPIFGNATDSTVNVWENIYYTIKMTNYDLYLTVSDINEGTNVYWAQYNGLVTQLWVFEQVTEHTLQMPQNLNQTYVGNEGCIQKAGCFVCSCCDVASYYRGSNYTLDQMKGFGVFVGGENAEGAECHWRSVPSVELTLTTSSTDYAYLKLIRSEIDAGRPVIVHTVGGYVHFVVAYGYIKQGISNSQIKVLDPSGANANNPVGRYTTLSEVFIRHKAEKISDVYLTARK